MDTANMYYRHLMVITYRSYITIHTTKILYYSPELVSEVGVDGRAVYKSYKLYI